MALREILADLSIRVRGQEQLAQANAGVAQATTGLRGAFTALRSAGGALGAALAIRQIARFTTDVIDAGDEIDKMSQSLGLSAEALQRWQFIAERSGVSAQELSGALLRLTRSAGSAAEGAAGPASAYRQLGVSVRDANGELKQGEALFQETILGLAGVENATQRSFIATQIFGRTGAALLPIVNGGAEGIAELTARFEELGGAMSDDAVAASAEAQDALADFDLVMTSLKGDLASVFLPVLTRVINAFGEFVGVVTEVVESSSALETVFGVLTIAAIALGVAMLPAIANVLLAIAPFVLLFLVVEDIVTAFRGGRSQIALFIDEIFGVGTAADVIRDLTAAWDGLTLGIRRGLAALRGEELPTASGRSTATAEGAQDERRRAAASQGRVVGAPGQSFEEATADFDRFREEAGLPALDDQGNEVATPGGRRGRGRRAGRGRGARGGGPGIPRDVALEAGRGPSRIPAAARAGGGDTNIEQTVTAPVTITVEGAGDPEAVAAGVARRQERSFARVLANAAANLPQAPGA